MFPSLGKSPDYLIGTDRDADSYWRQQAERHQQHRRSVLKLAVAIVAMLLLAVVLDPGFVWAAVGLAFVMALEWWMARRSRPTTKIPDHRPPDTVEVTLDDT